MGSYRRIATPSRSIPPHPPKEDCEYEEEAGIDALFAMRMPAVPDESFQSDPNTRHAETKKSKKTKASQRFEASGDKGKGGGSLIDFIDFDRESSEDNEIAKPLPMKIRSVASRNEESDLMDLDSYSSPPVTVETWSPDARIHALIMLQSFIGSYSITSELCQIIAASFKNATSVEQKLRDLATRLRVTEEVVATWAAVITFERGEGHTSEKDTWELVVEKSTMFLEGEGKSDDQTKKEVAGVLGL